MVAAYQPRNVYLYIYVWWIEVGVIVITVSATNDYKFAKKIKNISSENSYMLYLDVKSVFTYVIVEEARNCLEITNPEKIKYKKKKTLHL